MRPATREERDRARARGDRRFVAITLLTWGALAVGSVLVASATTYLDGRSLDEVALVAVVGAVCGGVLGLAWGPFIALAIETRRPRPALCTVLAGAILASVAERMLLGFAGAIGPSLGGLVGAWIARLGVPPDPRFRRLSSPADADRCPACGYLRTGDRSDRCPECGEPREAGTLSCKNMSHTV